MLPLLVSICVLLSKGSAETLWFPVPLLTDYEFSRAGGNPTDGLTTYVATASRTPTTTARFILPGDKLFLTQGSDIAIARVPVLHTNVDYSCNIGSDNHAQCVRTLSRGSFTRDIYSWTTSVCAATTVPPDRPTPLPTGRTNSATSESPWLPCPTPNDPAHSFVLLQLIAWSFVALLFLLGFKLITLSSLLSLPARKVDLTHWDAPPIEGSLIHLPSPSQSISPVRDDRREAGEYNPAKNAGSLVNDATDTVLLPSQSSSSSTLSSPASDLKTPPHTPLGTSRLAPADVREPLNTVISSAEIDLLAPRTTSVSAFCIQVLSSSAAKDFIIEGIETRLSRKPLIKQQFLLLRIRHGSRWGYLRIDMMGNLYSPSTLPAFDAPPDKADGPTVRIFDNQTPEAKELLLDQEMSTATFYATRWIVEYPGFDPTDISQLDTMKSKNPAHHYQLLEIGPENVASSKTPTLQDLARVLQLLEGEVASIARHPILRSLVPTHAALLWTIIPRTVLLAAHRPQWLIHHHRLSVDNLPHVPFLLRVVATFGTAIPTILTAIYIFNVATSRGSLSMTTYMSLKLVSVLSFASTRVLRALTVDVMIGRWRRQWDARAGIVFSRMLEKIGSRTLEENTLSRSEAIDLYHHHVTEQQRMEIFRLEPISTSSKAYYFHSGLGMGLSLSSHIILEPVPVTEFFSDDVLEPRQTTLGQFCADLRVDTRGSTALIEAVSWRKSRKQPFLHEFVLLLVRHGVQYYTVRIDRRGKLNKALDGLLLSGNAMEVVTINPWQQRNYRALDLFNEHEKSDAVVTLVSWHFDLPWLTNPGDPELAALAMQQSGTAIQELFQLGNATQLTASRRPKLGDLVVLWETMGREAPRYCLPSYNCYWQSRTMTFLIARRFPREFILRERTLPVSSIRELHNRSFVVGDFYKHWRPWYGAVGWFLLDAAYPAAGIMVAMPVTNRSIYFILGAQLYGLHYPGDSSFQNQWTQDFGMVLGTTIASMILTLGPLFFMGWNMNRATERMWNHVRQTDEVAEMELAELAHIDDTRQTDPISKRKMNKTRIVIWLIFPTIFLVLRIRSIMGTTNSMLKDNIDRRPLGGGVSP